MTVSIDLNSIANILSFCAVLLLSLGWILLWRKAVGFLVVVGASLTVIVAGHSDLSLEHVEATLLTGAISTGAVVLAFLFVRFHVRRWWSDRQVSRWQMAEYEADQRAVHARQRAELRPADSQVSRRQPEARSGQRPTQRHGAEARASRSGYVVNPRQPASPARGARLQQRPRSGRA